MSPGSRRGSFSPRGRGGFEGRGGYGRGRSSERSSPVMNSPGSHQSSDNGGDGGQYGRGDRSRPVAVEAIGGLTGLQMMAMDEVVKLIETRHPTR